MNPEEVKILKDNPDLKFELPEKYNIEIFEYINGYADFLLKDLIEELVKKYPEYKTKELVSELFESFKYLDFINKEEKSVISPSDNLSFLRDVIETKFLSLYFNNFKGFMTALLFVFNVEKNLNNTEILRTIDKEVILNFPKLYAVKIDDTYQNEIFKFAYYLKEAFLCCYDLVTNEEVDESKIFKIKNDLYDDKCKYYEKKSPIKQEHKEITYDAFQKNYQIEIVDSMIQLASFFIEIADKKIDHLLYDVWDKIYKKLIEEFKDSE
ncbi:hypothetical protein A0H76_497 [Hepatospora eriocheir]|uniref:Uncharacterized protein n=1 Tax=Hepatospora eriocheir TaxID=1081669 RepID=A0A1X0Q8S5_9MICR|nr:hypothetical protein A0H76_497 [Hepatospora eriocheir]